jgi:hypothetical protein
LGNLWQENNFIFTAANGKAIFPSTIGKWFKDFIRKHNEVIMSDVDIKKEDTEAAEKVVPNCRFSAQFSTHFCK